MKRMTEFNRGWWNCFTTLCGEVVHGDGSINDGLLYSLMADAGVTEDEVRFVLRQRDMTTGSSIHILKDWLDFKNKEKQI